MITTWKEAISVLCIRKTIFNTSKIFALFGLLSFWSQISQIRPLVGNLSSPTCALFEFSCATDKQIFIFIQLFSAFTNMILKLKIHPTFNAVSLFFEPIIEAYFFLFRCKSSGRSIHPCMKIVSCKRDPVSALWQFSVFAQSKQATNG